MCPLISETSVDAPSGGSTRPSWTQSSLRAMLGQLIQRYSPALLGALGCVLNFKRHDVKGLADMDFGQLVLPAGEAGPSKVTTVEI